MPGSQTGVGSSILNPTGFASPEGDTRRAPPPFGFFAPGNFSLFKVIEAVSVHCYRANSLFSVVFAVANPGKTQTAHFDQHLANRLEKFMFVVRPTSVV